jgi:signal recognition particle subunit SRP54
MLPGGGEMKKQIENFDEKELDRASAIISSMTVAEREDPKILNGSRRARIARGSGTEVSDVNSLVDRFTAAAKMMKQMAKGAMPNVAGMPNMAGMGMPKLPQQKKQQKSGKGAKKSGNPAKRAAQAAGIDLPDEKPADKLTELPSAFKGFLNN